MLLLVKGQHTQYSRAKCASICTDESEFEERLPLEPNPLDRNRIKQWTIVLLNQIRDNFDVMTPPGSARAVAIFSSCIHDAVAMLSDYMTPSYAKGSFRDREDMLLDYVIDGAAYEAISDMFFGKPSFRKVHKFLFEDLAHASPNGGFATRAIGDFLAYLEGVEARSFTEGKLACTETLREWKRDGFDGLGHPLEHTPDHHSVNEPQKRAGITNCVVEINDPDRWQPICVPVEIGSEVCEPQEFLGPLADIMHMYAIADPEDLTPPGPPLLKDGDEDEWQKQARQVLEFSGNLNDSNKIIAEHWADGPDTTLPPGHMFYIALGATEKQGLTPFDTAKVLFLVGAALNDAGVVSWASKLKFDFTRPLQMIQCGFGGSYVEAWTAPYRGVGTIDAAFWQPYQAETFVTPGFAGYVSGHSTFSAAAAGALIKFFGTSEYLAPKCIKYEEGSSLFEGKIIEGEENHIPGVTDVSNQGPRTVGYVPATDVVLCWETFEEAAEESGISRLHGGIHIIADHIDGNEMGFKIASAVYDKAQKLWS